MSDFKALPVNVEDLLRYYEARCAAAVTRGSSLIMAIPKGLGAECVAINLELTKQAMLNNDAAAHSEAIDAIFDNSPLVLSPCMEPYASEEEEARMGVLERVMRNGYARDRVMGINKIKKAMLNQGKIGATDAFLLKQKESIQYMKEWFAKFESSLSTVQDVELPSKAMETKREQWRRLADADPDSIQNQASFLQATPLHGTTRLQIEALAIDPAIENTATLAIAASEIAAQRSRDAFIGTETFVSFTFPPEEHELIVAAAGSGGGISKTETSFAYPAQVTFHSPTGEANSLAVAASGLSPNTLFAGDAAYLMTQVHALATEAKRACILLEHT